MTVAAKAMVKTDLENRSWRVATRRWIWRRRKQPRCDRGRCCGARRLDGLFLDCRPETQVVRSFSATHRGSGRLYKRGRPVSFAPWAGRHAITRRTMPGVAPPLLPTADRLFRAPPSAHRVSAGPCDLRKWCRLEREGHRLAHDRGFSDHRPQDERSPLSADVDTHYRILRRRNHDHSLQIRLASCRPEDPAR